MKKVRTGLVGIASAAVMLMAACSSPLSPDIELAAAASPAPATAAPAESAADVDADAESRNLFYLDKGYTLAGLSDNEFQNVWEMANLTARIYHDLWDATLDTISPWLIPSLDFEGNSAVWRTVEVHAENSGFYAEVVRHASTGAVVLVFRGTNPLSLIDWVNNIEQGLYAYTAIPSAQYDAAVLLARDVKRRFPAFKQIAGHSLGGGLAQLAALDTGIKATCFNSAGLNAATLARWNIDAAKVAANKVAITHYNIKYDPLSDLLGRRDTCAPLASTPQIGGKTYWLRNVTGTGFTMNPMRIANHMYHAYVYQLSKTWRYTGNFL